MTVQKENHRPCRWFCFLFAGHCFQNGQLFLIDPLGFGETLLDVNIAHFAVADADQAVCFAFCEQFHCAVTHARGIDAVAAGRRAAALHMA